MVLQPLRAYTWDEQSVIEIPDDPVKPPPNDIIHIPPLQKELECGFGFRYGGSADVSTFKLFDRFKHLEKNNPLVGELENFRLVLSKDASKTYKDHVLDSSAMTSSRLRNVYNKNRLNTKIQIKRFHITKGEFVDALKPNGEVCQVLMDLCAVAIMSDWDSKTKIILDQRIIIELMKSGIECNHALVTARLKKLPLDEIDEIYLPLLTESHWFLAVVNVKSESVEFYDSLLGELSEGLHPHKDLWDNLSANLTEAYGPARKKSVFFEYFQCQYVECKLQTTIHDCGFHVIQNMECHKLEDVVGHSKKKTMMPFRKYLSHILIFHRFNDLNPSRPYLRAKVP